MSRIDKWLPFFEEAATKRDTASWWESIGEHVLKWGMKVKGVVSDRARALIKLGKAEYLAVYSMPDLFHFCQDINKALGARIGKLHSQSQRKVCSSKNEDSKALEKSFKKVDEIYKCYRQEMEEINKSVHPFNEENVWETSEMVEEKLSLAVGLMEIYAGELEIKVAAKKKDKVLKQIKPISEGVAYWIRSTKLDLEALKDTGQINELEEEWLRLYAMPYAYWKIQLTRTQAKERNQDLRAYYKERVTSSESQCKSEYLSRAISLERANELLKIAHRKVITFQRSSSQVEGRNGYLAFINHGHKGIPKKRLKVLTVVHNYDVRRKDGSTPAERLFGRQFPDLFEFLCENVTGFKEPRKRKRKALTLSFVQP